jgi:MFS transporter, PAT family, beta-lactamase induction signal transducer AmpG
MTPVAKRVRNPAYWVPTSYLAEGIPFAMANWVVGTLLKDLGHADGAITAVTGTIGIAWSLKPLWAAFLDAYRSKKFFVLATEIIMAGLFAAIGLALKLPGYYLIIAGILWVTAFASATQDICVDGVYITSLDKQKQSAWMGWQGGFWNCGRFFGTSLIVGIAAVLADKAGMEKHSAWMVAMLVAAATMGGLALYHSVVLPRGSKPAPRATSLASPAAPVPGSPAVRAAVGLGVGGLIGFLVSLSASPTVAILVGVGTAASIIVGWREHVPPFLDFIKKKQLFGMLLFVFLYRSGEGFLLQLGPLFIQAPISEGGLGLTLGQKSFLDGVLGTIMSIVGAVLGGYFVSRRGLKRSLLILALSMNIPHICYIILSHAVSPTTPLPAWFIYSLYSLEKLGYNFGFVGNMLYMMQQIAPGKFKMTHYAFATAFMNLVLWPTQTFSGRLADWMGYRHYFIFVLIASIPSVIAAWKAPFPNLPDADEPEDEDSGPVPSPATVATAPH